MCKEGIVSKLPDVLGVQPKPDGTKEPPRLAANFWEEYFGKHTFIHTSFRRKEEECCCSGHIHAYTPISTSTSAPQASGIPDIHDTQLPAAPTRPSTIYPFYHSRRILALGHLRDSSAPQTEAHNVRNIGWCLPPHSCVQLLGFHPPLPMNTPEVFIEGGL